MTAFLTSLVAALVAMLISVGASNAQPPPHDPVPCRRATEPIGVDGRSDDPVWQHAALIDDFAAHWKPGARRRGRTRARLLWDDDYLYFLADMDDDDIVVASANDDDRLWLGDVVELFLKPRDGAPGYYELQVNPANARLDMYLPRRAADAYARWRSARRFEWETAVRRTAGGWTAEGRIPWSDFAPSGGRPEVGDTWRFAFCRYDYSAGDEPLLTSSVPLTQPSFHRWEEWAELRFDAR